MSIAKRIKQARVDADLTQADLAAAVDVSQPTVNGWERGAFAPSRDRVERIAYATTKSRLWLELGGEGADAKVANAKVRGGGEASSVAPRETLPSEADLPVTHVPESVAGESVAFQGIEGAYSHLACQRVYPQMTALPCRTFEAAFAAVSDEEARFAMIPIENSLGGRVADIHHLLPESSLYIVGEHFQSVQHHMLAPQGATLEGLRAVYSHVQALAQCRDVIRELNLEAVARADTAGAAMEVAEIGDPSIAAIASDLAGQIYGLQTIRTRIEDRIGNTTRMVVMSRRRIEPDSRAGRCITSFVFQVRSVPAALYKALGGFATVGVNIIKLESYIVDANFTVAQFYAEIEGHPDQRAVDHAFEELQYFSSRMKILGTYLASPFRDQTSGRGISG
jgi:prephenate dehydratase